MLKTKMVKKIVYWCDKCNNEIHGNGSIIYPYQCACGKWEFDEDLMDYKLIN